MDSSGNSKIIPSLVLRGHSALSSQLVASYFSGVASVARSIASVKAYVVFEKGNLCAAPPLRHEKSTGRLKIIVFLGIRTDGNEERHMSVLSQV